MRRTWSFLAIGLLTLLTACGGGGSDEPSTPETAFTGTVNVDAVATYVATHVVSASNLTAKDKLGNTWTLSVTHTPQPDDANGKVTLTEFTLKFNDRLVKLSTERQHFTVGPFAPVLSYVENPYGYFYEHTVLRNLPTSAMAGQRGDFLSSRVSYDRDIELYRTKTTWALESRSATTARLCFKLALVDVIQLGECFTVDSGSNVLALESAVLTLNNQDLTFR